MLRLPRTQTGPARHRPGGSHTTRALLPALLLGMTTSGLAGLAVLPAQAAPTGAVLAGAPVVQQSLELREEARASRSRALAALVLPSPVALAPRPVAPPPRASKAPAPSPAAAAPPAAVRASAQPAPRRSSAAARRSASLRTSGASLRCPVPSANFTDSWGNARSNGRRHQGTDMLASYGAPVYAVAAGRVDTTSSRNGGISLYLKVAGGDTYFYAHNSANLVSDGAFVEAGELIARVGATGNASGGPAHVHFERHPGGGGAVNPYRFLRGLCG